MNIKKSVKKMKKTKMKGICRIIDKNNKDDWRISEIINGNWEMRVYYLYTKAEAINTALCKLPNSKRIK